MNGTQGPRGKATQQRSASHDRSSPSTLEHASPENPEMEMLFRGIVEAAPDGIVIADNNGLIQFVNPRACELFGYQSSELIGQPIEILVPERLRSLHAQQRAGYAEKLRTRPMSARDDLLGRRSDGTEFPAEISLSCLSTPSGQLAVGIVRDTTERRAAEAAVRAANVALQDALDELREAQRRLIRQERLRALGEMASGIAHDFNNALTQILGFSELLLGRPAFLNERDTTIEFLRAINTGAKDAASVVGRLRQFYRPQAEDTAMGPVDLRGIVHDAIALSRPRWKDQALTRGVSVAIERDLGDCPPVHGHASELREILINLIFNAVDAMSESGTISISTRLVEGQVLLKIRDSGAGMTEQVRSRCFDPFFTTKGQEGTGLGLAMVDEIVQRLGARIDVQSELGLGTTFTIGFPLAANMGLGADLPDCAQPALPPQHVLLVDDDASARQAIHGYLTLDGHSVVEAADGCEGLALFNAEVFDVVITDFAMPRATGDTLTAAIKHSSPRKPVIMVTGRVDALRQPTDDTPKADVLVEKPITLAQLRRSLLAAVAAGRDEGDTSVQDGAGLPGFAG